MLVEKIKVLSLLWSPNLSLFFSQSFWFTSQPLECSPNCLMIPSITSTSTLLANSQIHQSSNVSLSREPNFSSIGKTQRVHGHGEEGKEMVHHVGLPFWNSCLLVVNWTNEDLSWIPTTWVTLKQTTGIYWRRWFY